MYVADVSTSSAEEPSATPGRARVVFGRHDLSEVDAPADAVAGALGAFGRLDGVVVTAGVHVVAPLEEFDLGDWDRTMAVNVRAPFLLLRAAAGALERTRGSVVLTGSTAAFRGSAGTFAYAASKGALVSLTRSLAVELAPRGIRVNSVCPGWIDTAFNDPYWDAQADASAALARVVDQVPVGRQGTPAEVAAMILHLLDPVSAYVTGQSVVIDGGLLSA